MENLIAAVLTPKQQETVAYFRALNVPADWFVGEPKDNGAVEIVALGQTFVWNFTIEANGEYSSQECDLDPEGFSTGITV